jgi:hypothetical protein
MPFERGAQALVAHHAARADAFGELLSLKAIFFTFGAVGGVKE